jgi:hypothetical protein
MADRHLSETREAAVGVQMFHLRQRWLGSGPAIALKGASAGPPRSVGWSMLSLGYVRHSPLSCHFGN